MSVHWSDTVEVLTVYVWVCLSAARSVGNERSRVTQIISTNIHKLTQNGRSFVTII